MCVEITYGVWTNICSNPETAFLSFVLRQNFVEKESNPYCMEIVILVMLFDKN